MKARALIQEGEWCGTLRELLSDMRRVQEDVVKLGTVTREVRDGQG